MDAASIRLGNLELLVERLRSRGNNQKETALALNLSPSYLSQLVAGKKMGDDTARKIEAAQCLPHGWMDVMQSNRVEEDHAPYGVSQPQRLDPETLAASITLVRLACENLGVEFDAESPGDMAIVLIAFDYLRSRSESAVTVDNVVDFTKKLRERTRSGDAAQPSATVGATRQRTGS